MREIIRNVQETKKAGFLSPRLLSYVSQCRKMRITDKEIRLKLLRVGWSEEEANRVLGKPKMEATISSLSPSSKPAFIEEINPKEKKSEDVRKIFIEKKKSSGFFSKKKILIIIISVILLAGSFFAVYYLIFKKNNLVFQNKEPEKNTAEVKEVDCSAKKFKKPEGTGSAVLRVDSTMKLLLDAVNEGNYCLAMSLFTNDSKDKHKDLVKKVLENEGKRIKFAQDLKNYMIPPIDENDPSGQAKATVTSSEGVNKQFYSIILSKEETGEYLISSM